jgi:maltooligosyltrehalose trehalohydrolase
MREFRVWAPKVKRLQLQCGGALVAMQGPDDRGWWSATVADVGSGTEYAYRIDRDSTPYPDPRSLCQPQGVHGVSQWIDLHTFEWTDAAWQAKPLASAILYELHIGTFTLQGTFDAAIEHLDHLVALGITHVEVMPIAEFAGDRGWGYDGVALYAVKQTYGGAQGFQRFVDACHAKGLAVVLDVVYNHFGPVGNYTGKFAPYTTSTHHTPWGAAMNFTEQGSDEVRRFFIDNAIMWLRDFHCDGLRLDAVHAFMDQSAVPFMEQLGAEIEQLGATLGRSLVLIAESDLNDPRVVRTREAGGYGMDAQWSDDFHHAIFSLLYRKDKEAGYYRDFGTVGDLAKALKTAFVYDGRYSLFRQRTHGRSAQGLSAHHFVCFTQNHDQVGNRAKGERLEQLAGMDAAKVGLGLLLCSPFVPMIFMGEEFAASTPFQYFADHEDPAMARAVSEGRKREFAAFNFAADEIPDPEDRATFLRSQLRWDEVQEAGHAKMLTWTKTLIELRRTTAALNDGDLSHLEVEFDESARWLILERGNLRIVANMGEAEMHVALREGERLLLSSSSDIVAQDRAIAVPAMRLCILQS